jgi:protein-disulfide isomerase
MNLPLSIHPNAMGAALAAVAAGEQGKFWEFHDRLFSDQRHLDPETYERYARELGLDVDRFEEDCASPQTRRKVEEDRAEARRLGVYGTPAFFVNGRFLDGAQPFDGFAKVIDAELVRLNLPLPAGPPSK